MLSTGPNAPWVSRHSRNSAVLLPRVPRLPQDESDEAPLGARLVEDGSRPRALVTDSQRDRLFERAKVSCRLGRKQALVGIVPVEESAQPR